MITKVERLTKTIFLGPYRKNPCVTLISYDGITWALDPTRALKRFKRTVQLHPDKKKTASRAIHSSISPADGSRMNANDGHAPFLIQHAAATRFPKGRGKKGHPLAVGQNRKLRLVKR